MERGEDKGGGPCVLTSFEESDDNGGENRS